MAVEEEEIRELVRDDPVDLFVPGQIGSGNSTQSNDGNNSVVQNGSSIPYSQVIERYKQMAHDAIDNSDISPDLKDLVHGYFNTLEGQ